MARFITLVLACQLATLPVLTRSEDNPLFDLASSLIQNMGDGSGNQGNGLAAIGSLVGSLMQGDNAKNLGTLFGQSGGNDANPSDILSGLGSLLGGQNGQIDPSLIGSMLTMFTQNMGNQQKPSREKRQAKETGGDFMSMASQFLDNKNMAAFLPVIMNTISSLSDTEANKRSHDHNDHASFLPPFVEKLHLYWDLFMNSELGKTVWKKSGLSNAMKSFTGPDGKLSFKTMFKSFENQSFRRHWIKAAAKKLTETVMHVAKPEVYAKYLSTAQYVVNGFIDAQGLPKSTHFNMNKPEKSLTALINNVLKKYMDIDTDVSGYVKQAIEYTKQTMKMAQATSKSMSNKAEYNVLADRITDTLNLEVIEPVLRVYRAYQHSVQNPQCQEHLMCLVNRHHDGDKQGLPGFKQGLTKFSSLAASAALSFQNGKGFWDLYNAIQKDVDCEAKYPADCATFHEHEQKVTTEVYHSEL